MGLPLRYQVARLIPSSSQGAERVMLCASYSSRGMLVYVCTDLIEIPNFSASSLAVFPFRGILLLNEISLLSSFS